MSKQTLKKLLLKQGDKLYYLLNVELSMSDGSIYLAFPRNGTSVDFKSLDIKNGVLEENETKSIERPNTKAISYHSSGRINFKNMDANFIYGEPLFDVTQLFGFFHISIPNISLLDEYTGVVEEKDSVLSVPVAANGRNTFSLAITPVDMNIEKVSGVGIHFEGLCNFLVVVNDVVFKFPEELNDRFVHVVPQQGLFESQKYSKEYSQLLFHQKVQGVQDVIIYPPNNEGVYRMYFAVPMRIPPKIKITFAEPGLEVVILEDNTRTKASARFKVKGKQGFIKERKEIVEVELDAEL